MLRNFIDTILNLSESEGLKLMKPFNILLMGNFSNLKPESISIVQTEYLDVIASSLEQLPEFLKSSTLISQKFIIQVSTEQSLKIKTIKLRDSIVILEELLTCLLLSIDRQFPSIEYIKSTLQKFIKVFLQLQLKNLKNQLEEMYFTDLLQLISRGMSFFCGLIGKHRESNSSGEVVTAIVLFLETCNENGVDLLIIALDFINSIPPHLTRLKVDAFSFMKTFFERYPERMCKQLKRIIADEFFTNSVKMRFSDVEINKIYYYWISTNKTLVKNHKKLLVDTLEINDLFILIENNIDILFEASIYPNYLLNLLHNIGNLVEVIKEKLSILGQLNIQNKQYSQSLLYFLEKLVLFLKQSRKMVQQLVENLIKKNNEKMNTEGEENLENLCRQNRDDIITSLANNSNNILKEELIVRESYIFKYYPEMLIQHSFNLEFDRKYKLDSFLEDAVVKKIGILNDIFIKFISEYFRATINEDPSRLIKETNDGKVIYILSTFTFREHKVMSKILSNNLKLFETLLINSKILEYENIYDNIKFSLMDCLVLRGIVVNNDPKDANNTGNNLFDVQIGFRDILKLFDKIKDKFLLSFREIYLFSSENYISLYSLLIDLFTGSGVLESLSKPQYSVLYCARQTNKAFNKIMINRTLLLLQKKEIESFSKFYGVENMALNVFALKVLKALFRKLKYRESSAQNLTTITEEVLDIKNEIFRVIVFTMQKVFEDDQPMVYLHLQRNLYFTVQKCISFCSYFTEEIVSKSLKILEFFYSLFNSGYMEFKIIATELLLFAPLDLRRFLRKEITKPYELHSLINILEFALELPDNQLVNRALQIFEGVLGLFSKNELAGVLNNRLDELLAKWSRLLKGKDCRFVILRKSVQIDNQKFRLLIKVIGKYAEHLAVSRDLIPFEKKSTLSTMEEIHFDFYDNNNLLIFEGFPLKNFIETLFQELSLLKERPWFSHFYSISISFMSLFTNKHKKGLEVLFLFLYQLLEKLDEKRQTIEFNEDKDRNINTPYSGILYEKVLECFYWVLFFIYPFRLTEFPVNKTEVNIFRDYVYRILMKEPKMIIFFTKFIIRNSVIPLNLGQDLLDLTLFNLNNELILYCLEITSKDSLNYLLRVIVLQEIVLLLTSGSIYQIQAGLNYFNNFLIDRWSIDDVFKNISIEKIDVIISSMTYANKNIDKRFSLGINKLSISTFTNFLKLIFIESSQNQQILNVLSNSFYDFRDFEELELFPLIINLFKENLPEFIIFPNSQEIISKQINSVLKTIKNQEEDRKILWTWEFQSQIQLLILKLQFAYEKGMLDNSIMNLTDEFVIIIQFINILKDEVVAFDRKERDNHGAMVLVNLKENLDQSSNPMQECVDNGNVYFADFELKLHPDRYDYIIKGFSIIIKNSAELISQLFKSPIMERIPQDSDKLREMQKMKEGCFNKLLEMCLRIEKKALKAILPFLPWLYQDGQLSRSEHVNNFKVLLRFFQKNEIGEQNVYIISKLVKNYPKLINFEGFMTSLEKNISNLEQYISEERSIDYNENKIQLIKAYFRLISNISLKNVKDSSRNSMKILLEKGIRIEMIFNKQNKFSHSIETSLFKIINKLSNSQVWDFIADSLAKNEENIFEFIFKVVSKTDSFALRERLCREELFIPKCLPINGKKNEGNLSEILKWNLLLAQVTKRSPYFLTEIHKFNAYFLEIERNQIDPLKCDYELKIFKEIAIVVLGYSIIKSPTNSIIRNLYLNTFLSERCFNLVQRLPPIVKSISSSHESLKSFLGFLEDEMVCFLGKNTLKVNLKNQSLNTFLYNNLSIYLIPKIAEFELTDNLLSLMIKGIEYHGVNTKGEDLLSFLNLVLAIIVRIDLEPLVDGLAKEFKERFLKFSWNNIVYPKEGNRSLKNISKLIISLMIKKFEVFADQNQKEKNFQLYEFILSEQEDVVDEDSGAIWLECVQALIPVVSGLGHDWIKSLLYIYDYPKESLGQNTQVSIHNRFFQTMSLLRDQFNNRFIEIIETRFFKEVSLSNQNVFDISLQILIKCCQRIQNQEFGASILEVSKLTLLFERLILIFKQEQEASKNYVDKFFYIVQIFMKIFPNIRPSSRTLRELFKPLKMEEVQREATLSVTRVLRTQRHFLELIYGILKKPENTGLSTEVTHYILNSRILHQHNAYLVHPQLFSVLHALLDICVTSNKNFGDLLTLANSQLKEMIEKRSNTGVFFALLVYSFIFTKAKDVPEFILVSLDSFIVLFLSYLSRKKSKEKNTEFGFKDLFFLPEIGKLPNHSILRYYKFFVTVMIKLTIIQFKNTKGTLDYQLIIRTFENVFKKLPNSDYDLKWEMLSILECIICPNNVKNNDLLQLCIVNIDPSMQFKLLIAATMENNTCLKESNNPKFQAVLVKLYSLFMEYFERNPLDQNMIEFWRINISPIFSLMDNKFKVNLIENISFRENESLFNIILFFVKNSENDKRNKLQTLESSDFTSNLAVFFCNRISSKSCNSRLIIDGYSFSNSEKIFSSFTRLQELEGTESILAKETIKAIILLEIRKMNECQKELFIFNTIDLIGSIKSIYCQETIFLIDLLLQINSSFADSPLIYCLSKKPGKAIRLLNMISDNSIQDILTDNTKILSDSVYLLKSSLMETLGQNYVINNNSSAGRFEFSSLIKSSLELSIDNFKDSCEESTKYLNLFNFEKNKPINKSQKNTKKHKENNLNSDIIQELTSNALKKKWIQAKEALGCWDDLLEISSPLENTDKYLESLCRIGDSDKILLKRDLLLSEYRPECEIDALTELLVSSLEIKETDRISPNKLKYKELTQFSLSESWIEIENPREYTFLKLLESNQKIIEFEEGWDFLFYERHGKILIEEVSDFLAGWHFRNPSKKRVISSSRRILSQRSSFVSFLMNSLSNYYEQNKTIANSLESIVGENCQIILKDGNKLFEQQLISLSQIFKLERKNKSFFLEFLSNISYSSETLRSLSAPVLYMLFKENSRAGNIKESAAILEIAISTTSPEITSQFLSKKAKMLLEDGLIEESLNSISSAQRFSPYNGKIYKILFELLSKALMSNQILSENIEAYWFGEFFDSMFKTLHFDFNHYSNKVFQSLFPVTALYRKSNIFLEKLKSFVLRCPAKFLRSHFHQLTLYLDDVIAKSAYERLCQSNLHDFYFILAHLTSAVKSISDEEKKEEINLHYHVNIWQEAIKILANYLPRKVILVENLEMLVNKAIIQKGLDAKISAGFLINEIQRLGFVPDDLITTLCTQMPSLNSFLEELRNQQLSKPERLVIFVSKLQEIFEEGQIEVGCKMIESKLLCSGQLVLEKINKNFLVYEYSCEFEEFNLMPQIEIIYEQGTYGVKIYGISKNQICKSFLILPKNGQKLIDNILFDKIKSIFSDIFIRDHKTFSLFTLSLIKPLFISVNWYLIHNSRNVSLISIHDSVNSDKGDSMSKKAVLSRAENQGPVYSIEKMKEIYPVDTLKTYIQNYLHNPDEIFFFKQKLAISLAFRGFVKSISNDETSFNNLFINMETGQLDVLLIRSLSDPEIIQPKFRFTPNFLELMDQTIMEEYFTKALVCLRDVLMSPKNEMSLYSLIILSKPKIEITVENLKKELLKLENQMNQFAPDQVIEKIESLLNNEHRLYEYTMDEKPWF